MSYAPQQIKPFVGCGVPVEIQAMPVESPRQARLAAEGFRVRHVLESQATLAEGRVGLPETLRSAKVRQAGIDPHAGAGGDDNSVRAGDGICGTVIGVVDHFGDWRPTGLRRF